MQFFNAIRVMGVVAIVFGGLTVFSGGRALFGGTEAQAAVGNAVPFVLWFNFMAGFGYVMAGVGLWLGRRWALWAAAALALTTGLVALAFGIHVLNAGAYEPRTMVAMGVRLLFWCFVTLAVWKNQRFKALS